MKFHDELNPKLWNKDKTLKDEVADKLEEIAEAFIEYLDIDPDAIKDVVITGSSASYNYTPHSDLDLHLKVDYGMIHEDCPIVEGFLWSMKSQFNKDHDISIYGVPVELYAESIEGDTVHNGLYSLMNAEWIDEPQKIPPTDNDDAILAKYNEIKEAAERIEDSEVAEELINKIYEMRKAGLNEVGEFSTENLAFKKLRDEGVLERLKQMKKEKIDKQLSLESYNEDFFSDMNIQNSNLSRDTIENFNSKLYKAVKEKLAADFSNYKFTVYARNPNNNLYVVETELFKLFPQNHIVNNFNTAVYVFYPDIAAEYIEDMGLAPLHNEEYKVEIDLSSSIDVIYSKLKQILNSSKINELIKKWPIYNKSSKYQRKQKEIHDYIYRPGKYDQRESYNETLQESSIIDRFKEMVNKIVKDFKEQGYPKSDKYLLDFAEEAVKKFRDDNDAGYLLQINTGNGEAIITIYDLLPGKKKNYDGALYQARIDAERKTVKFTDLENSNHAYESLDEKYNDGNPDSIIYNKLTQYMMELGDPADVLPEDCTIDDIITWIFEHNKEAYTKSFWIDTFKMTEKDLDKYHISDDLDESLNESFNTLDLYIDGQYQDTFKNEGEINKFLDDNNIDPDYCRLEIIETPPARASKHQYNIGDKLTVRNFLTKDVDYEGPIDVIITHFYDDDDVYYATNEKGETGYISLKNIISKVDESLNEDSIEDIVNSLIDKYGKEKLQKGLQTPYQKDYIWSLLYRKKGLDLTAILDCLKSKLNKSLKEGFNKGEMLKNIEDIKAIYFNPNYDEDEVRENLEIYKNEHDLTDGDIAWIIGKDSYDRLFYGHEGWDDEDYDEFDEALVKLRKQLNKMNEAEGIYSPKLIIQAYKKEQEWYKAENRIEDEQLPQIMLFIIEDNEIINTKLIDRKDVYTYQPKENEYYLDMTRDSGDVITDYNLEPAQKLVDRWNEGKKWESINEAKDDLYILKAYDKDDNELDTIELPYDTTTKEKLNKEKQKLIKKLKPYIVNIYTYRGGQISHIGEWTKNEEKTYQYVIEDLGLMGDIQNSIEDAYKEAKENLQKRGYDVLEITDDGEFEVVSRMTGVAYPGVVYELISPALDEEFNIVLSKFTDVINYNKIIE